jgi:hypothetical protein
MTYPLTVQITTRDAAEDREVRQQYVLNTRHPRWELVKILVHAFFTVKFR